LHHSHYRGNGYVMKKTLTIDQNYIDAERERLTKALSHLDFLQDMLDQQGRVVRERESSGVASVPRKMPTKRRILLGILANAPNGLPTREIIAEAGKNGYPLQTSNVSPKLSFYKEKGWLTLNGGVWSITPAGRSQLGGME
jgi:hypothetical protein